ncbi:hypothetical protein BX666DRAFT_1967442 [Dichotomocladium elegans]|nr:hypothetical protein BX666DRAFT_1967442 [Dichotomocladium elegans]
MPKHGSDTGVVDGQTPKKKKIKRSEQNNSTSCFPLDALPFELLSVIFILSSNPNLPLVSRHLFYTLNRCPDDIKIAWLLYRNQNDIVAALLDGAKFPFFTMSLLDKLDVLHGSEIRIDQKQLPTPLIVLPERYDLALRFLERGASPKKPQGYPLIKSAQLGRLDMVRTLVAFGADPSVKDNMALRVAAARNNRTMVRFLVEELGVKPDSETLRACVKKDLWDMVKFLVDLGAVPDMSTISACT